MRAALGWDVGGANVKVARLFDGVVTATAQIPCDVTEGLDALAGALEQALIAVGPAPRNAVTLTAELADCFPDRARGVDSVLDVVERTLFGRVLVYDGHEGRLLAPARARARPDGAASANWHATAAIAASRGAEGLLVDLGGSTTDMVPVGGGRVLARGRTDHERLYLRELVYTGVERTPLLALGPSIPFEGRAIPLMAERFATTGDVYRATGELSGRHHREDGMETADGAPATRSASLRRIARMIGLDAAERSEEAWLTLARAFRDRHLERLVAAGAYHRQPGVLVGTGSGSFLLPELAAALGRAYRPWSVACGIPVAEKVDVSNFAAAIAVATLHGETHD